MDAIRLPLAVSVLNFSGPEFLKLYALLALGAVGVVLFYRWRADGTRGDAPPPLPVELDGRYLAWLRGGESELIRITALELLQSQAVQLNERGDLVRNYAVEAPARLSSAARQLLLSAGSAATAPELLTKGAAAVHDETLAFDQQAQEDRLLLPSEGRHTLRLVGGVSLLGLSVLGGVKLYVALAHHHYQVGYLLALMVMAFFALRFCARLPRLSRRGQAFLAQAQGALYQLQYQAPRMVAARDPMLMVAAGAFGLGLLENTSYEAFQRRYTPPPGQQNTQASSGAGCSSCGGSSGWSSSSPSTGGSESAASSTSDSGGSGDGAGSSCGGGCGGCGGGGD